MWNREKKTDLKCYFPQETDELQELVRKTFSLWEGLSNLKCVDITRLNPRNCDITISLQRKQHWFRGNCQGTNHSPSFFSWTRCKVGSRLFPARGSLSRNSF